METRWKHLILLSAVLCLAAAAAAAAVEEGAAAGDAAHAAGTGGDAVAVHDDDLHAMSAETKAIVDEAFQHCNGLPVSYTHREDNPCESWGAAAARAAMMSRSG